jgi:DNA polymerase-3 subunit gamma/tau
MHVTLYRRYRPGCFSEVVSQDSAVDLLRGEISRGRHGHAYLFSGPRGCGKTSLARIVASALNCTRRRDDGEPCRECESCVSISSGNSLDVVEIDGASNRGIDEIRELKEHISLSPFSGKYKVYIIDEVHMLTEQAFNALLKTLEEPPETVVFVLATTEPHKVPSTIRSRCQHIPFHRIPAGSIVVSLERVSMEEGVKLEGDALWEIARESDGSLRDALSLLEQAIGTGLTEISLKDIRGILGGGGRSELEKLAVQLRKGTAEALLLLEEMLERGLNAERFLEGIFILFRDLLVASRWKDEGISALPLSEGEKAFLREESPFWKQEDLWKILEFCTRNLPRARFGLKTEIAFGMFLGLFPEGDKTGKKPGKNANIPLQDTSPSFQIKDETDVMSTHSLIASGTGRAEADVTPKGSPEQWDELLECFREENILLYSACVVATGISKEEVYSIIFPEENRFAFEMASSPRCLACLESIRINKFPHLKMDLLWGEKKVEVETVPDEKVDEKHDAKAVNEEALPRKRKARGHGETSSEPQTETVSQNGSNGLGDIQSFFNAELLILREENQDLPEAQEGETEEQ